MERDKSGEEVEVKKSNTCEVCGVSFKKPAYLKQHMLSHSLEVLCLSFFIVYMRIGCESI